MAKRGKKYKSVVEKVVADKEYSVAEAMKLVKELAYTKFDSTLEGHFNVQYKSTQNIRGIVQLPHGTGKKIKILVFAKGDKAEAAKAAGADFVGDDDLIAKVQGGWVDYNFVVATPDMMKEVGKLGQVLGKRGLMPKPKSGTVTNDVKGIIAQLKSGRIEYRSDKTGVVHMAMGKLSFTADQLKENAESAFNAIMKDKPSDAKGDYIVSMYIAGTMSPAVKINIKELRA